MTNTIISDMRQKAQEQSKESPLSFWLNHYADLIEDAQTATVRNCDRVRCLQEAKAKFFQELPNSQGAGNYWRRLCEWLLTEVEK